MFGVNSNRAPQPITIKKMMHVLIAANILSHIIQFNKYTDDNGGSASVVIKIALGYFIHNSANNMSIYAMFDDSYWYRVRKTDPISKYILISI